MWLFLLLGTQYLGIGALPDKHWLKGLLLPHLLVTSAVLLGALTLELDGLVLGRRFPMALGPTILAVCSLVAHVLLGAAHLLAYLPSKRLRQRLVVSTHDPC